MRLLSRRAAQSQARLLAQAPATLRAFAAEASAAGAPKSGGGSSTVRCLLRALGLILSSIHQMVTNVASPNHLDKLCHRGKCRARKPYVRVPIYWPCESADYIDPWVI